jgi:hypothetical protein
MGSYTAKKPTDLTKINILHMGELLWWSYYFGTSPENVLFAAEESKGDVKNTISVLENIKNKNKKGVS